MSLSSKKLGLLLSRAPGDPSFEHGLALAGAALSKGVRVYLYCLDEAVLGLGDARLLSLQQRGLIVYACAYGAQKRQIQPNSMAVFAGLGALSDIMSATDRFLSFN